MQDISTEGTNLSSPALTGMPHLFEAVSPSMKAVEAVVRELAHSSVPVLLLGERGTGKRTIAQRIHRVSDRPQRAFLDLTCAVVTPSELTAAKYNGGITLYLDEIADLSSACQERLLEMLSQQSGDGSDVHIICASGRNLEVEVRAGRFREDLYYRLSGVCLRIPPLRQRHEDVPPLMSFFLSKYSTSFQRPIPPLSQETRQLFHEHTWPGNLVELEAVARAIVAVGDETVAMGGLRSMLARANNGNGKTSLKEAARAASREAEKELILKVLTRTRWNRRRAAEELQISYKALLYKLKQIGYGEYGAT